MKTSRPPDAMLLPDEHIPPNTPPIPHTLILPIRPPRNAEYSFVLCIETEKGSSHAVYITITTCHHHLLQLRGRGPPNGHKDNIHYRAAHTPDFDHCNHYPGCAGKLLIEADASFALETTRHLGDHNHKSASHPHN